MRNFWLLLLLPFLLWAKAPLIAVNDLLPRGISKDDALIISDRLRAALLETGKVRVLEREEMDKILREQAFQKSGACDNSDCAVEIGRLLAVDRMVVGTVGKIGSLTTLSARILDVSTGEVLFTASQDNEGILEELLVKAVPEIASKLAKGAQLGGSANLGHGDLEVTVSDTDAILSLDGKPMTGKTPFFFEHLEAGPHRLEARTKNCRAIADIELARDDLKKISLVLDTGTAPAKFLSEPSGAMVYLDDNLSRASGTTPFKLDDLGIGQHKVTYHKSGFLDTSLFITTEMDQMSVTKMRLTPGGTLVLVPAPGTPVRLVHRKDTLVLLGQERLQLPLGEWRFSFSQRAWEPVDVVIKIRQDRDDTIMLTPHFASLGIHCDTAAEAWLDGAAVGKSPLYLDTVEPGSHTLVLRAKDRSDWKQTLHLRPGEKQSVEARLESRYAWLRVASNVPALVELDGTSVGSTKSDFIPRKVSSEFSASPSPPEIVPPVHCSWSSDTLAPRQHHLRLVADRRIPWETDVELAPGSTLSFDASLPWTSEELAHRKREQTTNLRIGFGVIGLVATAATAFFTYQYLDQSNQAKSIQADYDAARSDFSTYKTNYDQTRSSAKGNLTYSVVSGTIATLAAMGFGLTWAF